MRIGIGLPNLGASAAPDAIVRGAQHAERWITGQTIYASGGQV